MYYHGGSPIQATDDLQTLYLMNPNNIHQPHTNVVFLNSAGASSAAAVRALDSHAPLPQAQQLVGFPLYHYPHEYQTTIPSFDHNLWRSVDDIRDPNMSLPTPKCLSLSLSSDQTGSNKSLILNDQDFHGAQSSIENMVFPRTSSGVESKPGKVMGSKYLKAAQQILDEVANAGEGIAVHDGILVRSKDKAKIIEASINGGEVNDGAEKRRTMAQREDIQTKKAKLVAMLDEVEQRYRNYQHQMHTIVSLFEQTAGIGSSKSYTHLASRTISKQFRCLKDAISSQISALKNSIREQDENKNEGSRLDFSIHRFRQQSAWRTPRGLPERAVSVLRAWLFEHFLHPYPKDLDKNIMAKQTGLSRSQVSNWFINARVRLWKPMVEEMYLEEMKNQLHSDQETNGKADEELLVTAQNDGQEYYNCSTTTTPKIDNLKAFQSKKHNQITIHPSTGGTSFAELIRSLNMDNNPTSDQIDPKKAKKDIGYSSRSQDRLISTEQKGSVSLTLALPPSASTSHWSPDQLSQHQQNLPSNSTFEFGKRINLETGVVESGGGSVNGVQGPSMGYEILHNFQNRNPFSAQLFPDFMA